MADYLTGTAPGQVAVGEGGYVYPGITLRPGGGVVMGANLDMNGFEIVNSGAADKYFLAVNMSANQQLVATVAGETSDVIEFDAVRSDFTPASAPADYNTSTSIWTCPEDGFYEMEVQLGYLLYTGSIGDQQIIITKYSGSYSSVTAISPPSAPSMYLSYQGFVPAGGTLQPIFQLTTTGAGTCNIIPAQSAYYITATMTIKSVG